jgi:peptidyl-prolyl cis-trans isomerase D
VDLDLHRHRLCGGFLFLDTSGLLGGRDQVTTSTAVASVNGTDIPYLTWMNVSNAIAQQREQQMGRGLNGDERRAVEEQAFEQLVSDVLLQQEYRKRGIRVSDEEVIQQARTSPPRRFSTTRLSRPTVVSTLKSISGC